MSKVRIPIKERFMKHVIVSNDVDGCWLWKGSIKSNGYGIFHIRPNVNGQRPMKKYHTVSAHRVAWEIYHGFIPMDMNVLHKCDVRNCVSPRHLFLGSQKDNIRDAIHKGRMDMGYLGKINKRGHFPPGSAHPNAKLTENDVKQIRKLLGKLSQEKIARMFNVTRGTIKPINLGIGWKHVK